MFLGNLAEAHIRNNTIVSPVAKSVGRSNHNFAQVMGKGPSVKAEFLERARHPFYGVFLMGADNVVLCGNEVFSPPDDFEGVVGVGPWSRNVTVLD